MTGLRDTRTWSSLGRRVDQDHVRQGLPTPLAANGFWSRTIDDGERRARPTRTWGEPAPVSCGPRQRRPRLVAGPALQRMDPALVNLRPFIAAGRAHQVLVAGDAGAVNVEVEPGIGEAQVPIEAIGRRTGVPASLAIVGPVTDRAGGTPSSVATARTSRQCLLTHAGKPVTSMSEATGLPGDGIDTGGAGSESPGRRPLRPAPVPTSLRRADGPGGETRHAGRP